MICAMIAIETDRLILRSWQEEDLVPFAAMNADPRVMEYFPSVKNYGESLEEYNRHKSRCEEFRSTLRIGSWGFWAVGVKGGVPFIGFIGLNPVSFTAHFTPAVEIGWRLAADHWGKGYATEGAKASLKFGFETLNLPEIVSFTPVQNKRSRAVMEKIGMHHNLQDDFDHPQLPEGHKLRKHVLYRLKRSEWA